MPLNGIREKSISPPRRVRHSTDRSHLSMAPDSGDTSNSTPPRSENSPASPSPRCIEAWALGIGSPPSALPNSPSAPALLDDSDIFTQVLDTTNGEDENALALLSPPASSSLVADTESAGAVEEVDELQKADALTPWEQPPPQTWSALAAVQRDDGKRTFENGTEERSSRRKRSRKAAEATEDDNYGGALSEEEQKRIRRVKNRASVEKCRSRQRMRLDSLNKERDALTEENCLLKSTCDSIRTTMQIILEQVAALSGVQCHVQL